MKINDCPVCKHSDVVEIWCGYFGQFKDETGSARNVNICANCGCVYNDSMISENEEKENEK